MTNGGLTQKLSRLPTGPKKYYKPRIEEVSVEIDDTTTTKDGVDEAVKSTTNEICNIGNQLETDRETNGKSTVTKLVNSSEESSKNFLDSVLAPTTLRSAQSSSFVLLLPSVHPLKSQTTSIATNQP